MQGALDVLARSRPRWQGAARFHSAPARRLRPAPLCPRPAASLSTLLPPPARRRSDPPALRFQRRTYLIDSEIYEEDTWKTRFYNGIHRTVVSAIVLCCIAGCSFIAFISYKLHTQGKKVKLAAMRARYLKDLLRQHRVLIPFNEANMDLKPLKEYYTPMVDADSKSPVLKFYDLVEEPIYGTIAHKFNQAGHVFDWQLSGEVHIEDYCVTLAVLTYFARQPMRDETTKRIRLIGDEFFKMLKSWNVGTPNEGKVTVANVCAFSGACFGLGLAAPPQLGKNTSYDEYRETYVKTVMGDMGLTMDSEVTRKMFTQIHGNMQYSLGLVPQKMAKNRAARQI